MVRLHYVSNTITSQLRYLFLRCSYVFLNGVRIALYFGASKLRMNITLVTCRFCSSLLRIFITSQLRHLFVPGSKGFC